MSAAAGAAKVARKLMIAANWKSVGTLSGVTGLVGNVLNKLKYDPKKLGTLPWYKCRPAGSTSKHLYPACWKLIEE